MFEKIEKFVACACVAVMAVLVFANVVARFVFKHSLAVSDEMSTYLFVLMSFMGTAIAAQLAERLMRGAAATLDLPVVTPKPIRFHRFWPLAVRTVVTHGRIMDRLGL